MSTRYFEKQPNESFTIGIDYSGPNALPSGTALQSGTVTAVNLTTGNTDTSVLSSTTATIDAANKLAKVGVQAGTSGTKYKITFLTTLDDGSVLEDDVIMRVEDY
ncbi:hypothetical protein D6827_03415 [Candidatus Parcubacteria bacterium]|nr:MAG: hypothetical protein D6827_03415 [Candidatus Parcubacteria bacterium]